MLPTLIMNIVTDLCIMAIPAPVVLPAKTTLWRKVSLVLLFSGAFFIMIAAILRVTYVMVVSQPIHIQLKKKKTSLVTSA